MLDWAGYMGKLFVRGEGEGERGEASRSREHKLHRPLVFPIPCFPSHHQLSPASPARWVIWYHDQSEAASSRAECDLVWAGREWKPRVSGGAASQLCLHYYSNLSYTITVISFYVSEYHLNNWRLPAFRFRNSCSETLYVVVSQCELPTPAATLQSQENISNNNIYTCFAEIINVYIIFCCKIS